MRFSRVLLGALILATASRPAAAALPPGINLTIPAGAPTLDEIETAVIAPVPSWNSPGAGLTPLSDTDGNPVVLYSDDGAYGGAFTDASGNTIISYQLSMRQTQWNVAVTTMTGIDPGSIPAYNDALAFAQQVVARTVAQGRSASQVYVTGFSEGGMLASFVGWRTGIAGVTFGSCGMPGYTAPGVPARNFISFVEAGDPIAQYGTDGAEWASAVVSSPHMDHYGTVLQLEAPGSDIQSFASGIAGHTLPQLESGTLGLPQSQIDALYSAEGALQASYHNWALYFADASALAAPYGY